MGGSSGKSAMTSWFSRRCFSATELISCNPRNSRAVSISASDPSQVVNQTLNMMLNRSGIVALVQYVRGSGNSTDAAFAVAESLTSVLKASSSTIGPVPAAQAGMITGFGHVYTNVNAELNDISPIANCLADPSCVNAQAAEMQLQ